MIILLHRRIIQHGVNRVYLAVLLCSLDSLQRTPMLDLLNMRCSGLLSYVAVCRIGLLSTWLSLLQESVGSTGSLYATDEWARQAGMRAKEGMCVSTRFYDQGHKNACNDLFKKV